MSAVGFLSNTLLTKSGSVNLVQKLGLFLEAWIKISHLVKSFSLPVLDVTSLAQM